MRVIKSSTDLQLDGFDIERVELINDNGVKMDVLSVGCVIEGLYVPDRNGHPENIVLKYGTAHDYLVNEDYLGSIVGRTAGRISGGRFTLEGRTYELEKNMKDYNLHAGSAGLHLRNWHVETFEKKDLVGVVMTLFSRDGEGGYPGNVELKVTYTLDNENRTQWVYEGLTDLPTVLNMTNHSYFNLSGNLNNPVLDHKLQIRAQQFAPIQEDGCPVGLLAGVDGTAFDFREEKRVGEDIRADETQIMRGGGFDHPFVLEKSETPQIQLTDENSGRRLKVWTDQDAVVIYTANHMEHKAICLETQNLPDNVNKKGFPFEAVTPEKPYRATTVIEIDVLKD